MVVGHFGVARQAEAAVEEVFAYAAGADGFLLLFVELGDEAAILEHGLHMHGFPCGAALDVLFGERVEDVHKCRLAVARQRDCGQPIVGLGAFCGRRERDVGIVLERLCVDLVDVAFLRDTLVEDGHLSPADAGAYVAEAIVVADLLMLIPREFFARLRRPKQHFVARLLVVAHQHAAAARGDDLVAVERKDGDVAEVARLDALVACAEALGGVFEDGSAVLARDREQFVELGGIAVKVDDDDRFGIGILLIRLFERRRAHVVALEVAVDEDELCAEVGSRVAAAAESERRTEHDVAPLDPEIFESQMNRGGACGKRNGIWSADVGAHFLFEHFDVLAERRDPIGVERFLYVAHFFAAHMRRTEINSVSHFLTFPTLPRRYYLDYTTLPRRAQAFGGNICADIYKYNVRAMRKLLRIWTKRHKAVRTNCAKALKRRGGYAIMKKNRQSS